MKKILILTITLLVPGVIFAADGLSDVFGNVETLLGTVKNLIFALAFIGFFYGLMLFIFKGGDDKEKGKGIMIWGVIALFVMFSIMGIIKVLQGSFGDDLSKTSTLPVPSLDFK